MESNFKPDNYNLTDDSNIDFKRYLSLFLSNWYWFAIALFIAVSLAYGINRYSEKIWTVSSTLLIKDDQFGGSSTNIENVIPGGDIFKSQQNLRNEIGILKSFMLNYRVMKRLTDFQIEFVSVGRRGIVESRIYKSCPFKIVYDSLVFVPAGRVLLEIEADSSIRVEIEGAPPFIKTVRFGEEFIGKGYKFTVIPRNMNTKIFENNYSNKYYFYFTDAGSIANQYRGKLTIEPIEKDATLVNLSVSGPVMEQEADYLNMLMKEYIEYGLEYKIQSADSTIKFIDSQIVIISDSLKKAETRLETFRKLNSFIDLSREGAVIQNKLERYENEKATFDLQLQYYYYLSEYLKPRNSDGNIISPSIMGITDPALIRLVNELSGFQKEQQKLNLNFNVNQPAVELMEKQVQETKEALSENIKNGIESLSKLIEESKRQINLIEAEINKLPTTEKELISIQRKFDLNNTVYTYLLEKRSEAGIARASNLPDNRIIDNASQYSSRLIKPKIRFNYMIALLLGIILPMVVMTLIDYFNNKIIDRKDVERRTNVPVIGYISHSIIKDEIAVTEKPRSSLAESFRSVRTTLKYFIKQNQVPIISISSTISSEGKTFISINLAAITAMLGKKVLLIGLDLRKPRINKVFEFDETVGMSNYLSGNCEFEDVIKTTQIENLYYAPSGPIPPNPAELIENELMKKFLEKTKQEFDYIIIDTPPVAVVTDALLLAPYANINLFIVRQRYSSRDTIEMIEQLNLQGELKNMAIIINDINLSGYYGYGMRYGYTVGYGYSYGYNYYGKGYYGKYDYKDKANDYYTD